jgi:integrase
LFTVRSKCELLQQRRGTVRPWSAEEARLFLTVSRPDPLYLAFVMLILYGLRRGEALGLQWDDIDFDTGTLLQLARRRRRARQG